MDFEETVEAPGLVGEHVTAVVWAGSEKPPLDDAEGHDPARDHQPFACSSAAGAFEQRWRHILARG
jgi:hypothetical protein